MKKLTLALSAAFALGTASQASAQVQDVSVTVSPVAGYNFWNKNLNLGDNAFYGARVGFGFGPLFELRATYDHSYDLKGKLTGAGWSVIRNWGENLEDTNAKIERFGGEAKINLLPNTILTPYVTGGAGVIKFKYTDNSSGSAEDYREKQLYASFGAGVKVNLLRRVVLSLEAKDMLFNVNENNRYLAADRNPKKTLHNLQALVSLDFYLGGRQYDSDAVSKAYRNFLSGGFRGIKFVLEPGVAYLDFKSSSAFRDQWMIGGSAGVDFNSLLGVRGFYYEATRDADQLSLHRNRQLRMYGGNFIAKLNSSRGIVPYLTLGGGYLNVNENEYVDRNGTNLAKGGWFAFGGGGVEVSLHRSIALFGNVNAMLNKSDNPDPSEIYSPSDVKVNWMYQAGLRINIGRYAKSGVAAYEAYADNASLNARREEREASAKELAKIRSDYDARIKALNAELVAAAERNDSLSVRRVLAEKAQIESKKAVSAAKSNKVVLTKDQFEELVQRVVKEVNKSDASQINAGDLRQSSSLSDFDKLLIINAIGSGQYRTVLPLVDPTALSTLESQGLVAPRQMQAPPMSDAMGQRLVQATDSLRQQNMELQAEVTRLTEAQRQQSNQPQVIQITESGAVTSSATMQPSYSNGSTTLDNVTLDQENGSKSTLKFNNISVFTGPNFGDAFNWNIGLKSNLQIGSSSFDLVPEVFVGLGSSTGFGIGANVHYNFSLGESLPINPYVGLGLGYTHIGFHNRFSPNIVLGAYLKDVLGGRLFVDYTSRSLFKNNQIAVGYTFNI